MGDSLAPAEQEAPAPNGQRMKAKCLKNYNSADVDQLVDGSGLQDMQVSRRPGTEGLSSFTSGSPV